MHMTFYTQPVLSLLSKPDFTEPAHLKIEWKGPEASGGERLVEYAGRLCYMSQHNPAGRTTAEYIENLKKQAHGSVMEHANYSVLFEGVSRSFTHELVRHRAGWAFSQLSQRYVDESNTSFVVPPAILDADGLLLAEWKENMLSARDLYTQYADELFEQYAHIPDKVHRRKTAREAARSVLPNATETKVVATANIRAWRSMLELRCGEGAEREIRRAMVDALRLFQSLVPAFFQDFTIYTAKDGWEAARTEYHKV